MITQNAGNIGSCSYKVGACRKCGSLCKQYKCACNGILPINALVQGHGRPLKCKTKGRIKKASTATKKHQLRPRRKRMTSRKGKGKAEG